jgi:hypothetical protein
LPSAVGQRRLALQRGYQQTRENLPVPFMGPSIEPWPGVDGYQVTRARSAATTYLSAPRGDPLLAAREFGRGRVVALPAGLGRLASEWPRWARWKQFADGLLLWAAGQAGSGRMSLTVHPGDTVRELRIDLVDSRGEWHAPVPLRASLQDPAGNPSAIELRPVAPGSYRGRLRFTGPGDYRIDVRGEGLPGASQQLLVTPGNTEQHAPSQLEAWSTLPGVLSGPAAGTALPAADLPTIDRRIRPLCLVLSLLVYLSVLLLEAGFGRGFQR